MTKMPMTNAAPGFPYPVVVINLDSRPDRWAAMESRLARAGLTAVRQSAFGAQEAMAAGYQVVRPLLEVPDYELTPGQIGCASSHLAIYRRMVEEGISSLVILEDDTLLAEDFGVRAARAIERRAPHTNVIQLGRLFESPRRRTRVLDAIHQRRHGVPRDRSAPAPFGVGTHCYWTTLEFAQAAVRMFDPIYAPIDCMLAAVTQYSSWRCEVHWPTLAPQDDSQSDIAATRPWSAAKPADVLGR